MVQTFTEFIESIFGTYTPCLIDDGSGTIIESAINWGYIASVVIFIIFMIYVLKTIGGVIYEWLR